jgi:hypothetical protein
MVIFIPKLEVPRLTCPGRESNPVLTVGSEHSRKETFEKLIISYSKHLHMSPRHGWLPLEHVVT